MFRQTILMSIALSLLVSVLGGIESSQAQSRIYGTLRPIRSAGKCNFNATFPTDTNVNRVAGLWFLFDKQDTLATPRGLELLGGAGSSLPSSFVSTAHLIPGTTLMYTSNYSFAGWDKKRKTVNMLKQSWVFTGWGSSTQIHCSGVWAAEVKYK